MLDLDERDAKLRKTHADMTSKQMLLEANYNELHKQYDALLSLVRCTSLLLPPVSIIMSSILFFPCFLLFSFLHPCMRCSSLIPFGWLACIDVQGHIFRDASLQVHAYCMFYIYVLYLPVHTSIWFMLRHCAFPRIAFHSCIPLIKHALAFVASLSIA